MRWLSDLINLRLWRKLLNLGLYFKTFSQLCFDFIGFDGISTRKWRQIAVQSRTLLVEDIPVTRLHAPKRTLSGLLPFVYVVFCVSAKMFPETKKPEIFSSRVPGGHARSACGLRFTSCYLILRWLIAGVTGH